ncbi:hypothetical protein Mapa_002525 [Marchantia paleacea]|nr:hypothetical protein Mapa_002525 [Marchantia paleacea]
MSVGWVDTALGKLQQSRRNPEALESRKDPIVHRSHGGKVLGSYDNVPQSAVGEEAAVQRHGVYNCRDHEIRGELWIGGLHFQNSCCQSGNNHNSCGDAHFPNHSLVHSCRTVQLFFRDL